MNLFTPNFKLYGVLTKTGFLLIIEEKMYKIIKGIPVYPSVNKIMFQK